MSGEILYYTGVAAAVFLSSGGVAIGQGMAGGAAAQALSRQMLGRESIGRSLLLGLVFIESGGILAFVMGIVFWMLAGATTPLPVGLAAFAPCFGIGITAGVVGIASGSVVQNAVASIIRQPFHAKNISFLMLMTQVLLEAPVIFSLLMCFFIQSKLSPLMTMSEAIQYAIAGVIIAVGSCGPAIGQAFFAGSACRVLGRNGDLAPAILSFSFMTQALIETPVVFSLVLGVMVLFQSCAALSPVLVTAVGGGILFSFGFGALGAAIGSGMVGARALSAVAENPTQQAVIFRTAILCQAIIDTALIYTMIISFTLINQLV